MDPYNQVQSHTPGTAQAPQDNVRKRRASARVANSSSKKKKFVSDKPDGAEDSGGNQVKVKRHKWGRVVGRLAGLMELPMDILFEIFGHLRPLDVLRLARTTKQFRQLLMHRSAASIWIAARKNVPNLPDCPPYMSEPQFANLVFDAHCHECLSPNIRSVDWRIGRRICSKCVKGCMKATSLLVDEQVRKAVPSRYGKRGRPSCYSKDLQKFQAKKASFTDPEEYKKFVKERQELVCQMEKHGALLEAWAANQAKDRSGQLEDLRRERKEAIIGKLKGLGWGPEIEQIPDDDDLSHHKLVRQPTRLTPRIWANIRDEMVAYMELMEAQRLERDRKALVISRKAIAVSVLRAYKFARLPFTGIMPEPVDFCAIPQVSDILELPTKTEVTADTFAPIVEKMDELVGEWRAGILTSLIQKVKDSLHPQKPQVDTHDFADTAASIPVDGKASIGKGKAKAVEAEPSTLNDSRIIQDLSLATTVFNCKCCNPRLGTFHDFYNCDSSSSTNPILSEGDYPWDFGFGTRRCLSARPLFYPMVLGHRCLTKQPTFMDDPSEDSTEQYDYPFGRRTRWECDLLQVDETASKMASNVITTCGLDLETTTVAEMDQVAHQLACLDCLEWSDEQWDQADALVFSWRGAVTHNCRAHPGQTNVNWMLIEDDLADSIIDVDAEHGFNQAMLTAPVFFGLPLDEAGPVEEVVWLCAHCLDLPTEKGPRGLANMRSHAIATHLVSEPQENHDYYRDFEALQSRKARIPCLKITLNLDRPDDVPGLGQRRIEDEYEDEWYDDYFSFS